MLDLNHLLSRRPDFYELNQVEQVKYIAFMLVRNREHSDFLLTDLRQLFKDLKLVVPTNLSRAVNKLTLGKPPILVTQRSTYSFHPKADRELTLEIFGSVQPHESDARQRKDIALFGQYELHEDIKRVSFSQFQDGYYKEAIQNAFVEVIDQIKVRTGHPKATRQNGKSYDLDGDDLVQTVFGADGRTRPRIAFNDLSNSLEIAEQRGIMYLFKGIVGIRDKKAHLNYIQDDPVKALEYLSLASLLMRLLDENPPDEG